MKNRIFLLIVTLLLFPDLISAQQPYIPPDFFGEPASNTIAFYPNQGQIIDTDGDSRPEIKYSSFGASPKLYLKDYSSLSYVMRSLGHNL